jgi:hypothetical protein
MCALHHGGAAVFHVVAQIVEAEFVVGAVGDVGSVGFLALLVGQAVDDAAGGEAEEAVDLAHPFAIALGEVIVDGDDMHAFARERIQIDGQGGDESLAFAGFHLGDVAAMQDHAADELHVEVALAEGALGSLADDREGFVQDVFQRLALGEPVLEKLCLGAEVGVAHRLVLGLERIDARHALLQGPELPVVGGAEETFQAEHEFLCRVGLQRPNRPGTGVAER